MRRALIGAGIGAVCGVLALAAAGAWGGYTHGDEWVAAPAPPPAEAAVTWALRFTAYYGWLAGAMGGAIGGLAGLGNWAVRPRPRVKTSAVTEPSRAFLPANPWVRRNPRTGGSQRPRPK